MANSEIKITVDLGNTTKLDPWGQKLKPTAVKVMQKAFGEALPVVKANERRKTGNMINQTVGSNKSDGAMIAANAGYSGYQNFGTRYMSGTHFMEAGVGSITRVISSDLVNELSKVI